MEMLAALPPTALPVTGQAGSTVDVVVAAEVSGSLRSVTALLTNYDIYTSKPGTQSVQLVFGNAPAGAVLPSYATLELIDSTHANPVATWRANGSPAYPNATALAAELAASRLIAVSVPLVPAGAGAVGVTVSLEAFAVARVRFAYELTAAAGTVHE